MRDVRVPLDDGALIRVLKALAEPRRFRIIQELRAAGELSCRQLGARFPLAQPTISHHLKILNGAGLLVVRREAQHVLVSVNQELVDRVLGPRPPRPTTGAPRDSGRWHGTPTRHRRTSRVRIDGGAPPAG